MLTNHELHSMFDYDFSRGVLLWKKSRNAKALIGDDVGCLSKNGYITTLINKKNYMVHRLIWQFVNDCVPQTIDHINGDKSDNRIENLRNCSLSENAKNKGVFSSNKSGFKGVSWCSRSNKFQTSCKVNGVKKWIGYFETAQDAFNAYQDFARKHHGSFFRDISR